MFSAFCAAVLLLTSPSLDDCCSWAPLFNLAAVALVVGVLMAALGIAQSRLVDRNSARAQRLFAVGCFFLVFAATATLWGREELAARCLAHPTSQTCVDRYLSVFPHRLDRAFVPTLQIATATCFRGDPPRWVVERFHVSAGLNSAELTVNAFKHICQNHSACCTELLHVANQKTWSPEIQRELDRWNNALPWQRAPQ